VIREIAEIGEAVLRTVAAPVVDPAAPETRELARDMADTLKDFQRRTGYGRGIAAPQVRVPKRMIVVDMPELGGVTAMINPIITERSAEMFDVWDACFSYFFVFFQVRRHKHITVEYDTIDGEHRSVRASGDLSELLQHETEHLDGELAIDKVTDPRTFCTVRQYEIQTGKRPAACGGS